MNKISSSAFKRLLGSWKTTGTIKSADGDTALAGTDTYEILPGGFYILHKADVNMGAERNQTHEIIGLDDVSERAMMHYFNSNGEKGTMLATILENEFNIEGIDLKFIGTINTANTLVTGKWYRKTNTSWTTFIELRLEKQAD